MQKTVYILFCLVVLLCGCMRKMTMAELHCWSGERALQNHDYARAVEFFTKALNQHEKEKGPDYNPSAIYVNRGVAYMEMAEWDKAEADFACAINENPRNPVAYHNRGFVRAKREQYAEAESDLSTAIDLAGYNYPQAYFSRAQIREVRGKKEMALQDYKTSLTQMEQQGLDNSDYAIHIRRKIAELEKQK